MLFSFERLYNSSSHFRYFTHVLIYFFYSASGIITCKWISTCLPIIWVGIYERGTQWEIRVQIKFTHFLDSGFPGKLTLRQEHACYKIIGACSREQCLWEHKGARIGQWKKLICKTTAAETLGDVQRVQPLRWLFSDIPYLTGHWMPEEGIPLGKAVLFEGEQLLPLFPLLEDDSNLWLWSPYYLLANKLITWVRSLHDAARVTCVQ